MAAVAAHVPEVPASEIARRRTFRDRWYRTPSFVAGAFDRAGAHPRLRSPLP